MTAEPANPRASRTKAALMAAGQLLFSRHPIDAVTVDDIVQAAEVGKGSFYNHFADREALARAIAAQIRSSVESAIARANAGVEDPACRMARAVCTASAAASPTSSPPREPGSPPSTATPTTSGCTTNSPRFAGS